MSSRSTEKKEITIDLSFGRQELNNVLSLQSYKPEKLVELFRTGVRGMEPPIFDRGGHVGFPTSASHALKVLTQFEDYYAHLPLPGGIDTNLFRVILVLHDIGYPLGGRYDQHDYTVPMVQTILEDLNYTEAEIKIAIALISRDPLGFYFTQEPGFKHAEDAMELIQKKSEEAGMSFEDFFELLVVFYTCDASSYQHLQRLFDIDTTKRKITYKDNVKIGMDACREVLTEVLQGILKLN